MNFQLFKTIPNRTNRITRYQHLFLFYIILKRCLDLTYSRDGFFFSGIKIKCSLRFVPTWTNLLKKTMECLNSWELRFNFNKKTKTVQMKFCSCFALMTNALITVIIKLIIIFAVVLYTVNSILNIIYIKNLLTFQNQLSSNKSTISKKIKIVNYYR